MSKEDTVEDIVNKHYEQYPYPERNPEDETRRLLPTVANFLAKINFYCFEGRSQFQNFRVLVAGAGTGDAIIFLAEQLRNKNAEIVYLDLSSVSMDIARRRAQVRGLNNITWLQHSLLDIPKLDLGKFDYINCSGVLHHLEDPEAGLKALVSALGEDGAMSIMVYGKYGRTGVYQMQELLRLINDNESNSGVKINNARKVLEELPSTNWFRRGVDIYGEPQNIRDIELYDLLLHAQDRAYTVPELHDFIRSSGLNFVSFACGEKHRYNPAYYTRNSPLREKIRKLDLKTQHAVAELWCGNIAKHIFYISKRTNTIAQLDDLDNVPFFFRNLDQRIFQAIINNPGQEIGITLADGTHHKIRLGLYNRQILRQIDGKRSLGEVLDTAKGDINEPELSINALLEDFRPVYNWLNEMESLLLRHNSVEPYDSMQDMMARFKT